MVERGTRWTTERVQVGNSPPTVVRAPWLSRQPHAPFDVAGAGNVIMAAGLRSLAKAMELPPAPTVRAPALDPTDEREEETELSQTGLRRRGESPANRHREATVTAPLLDSTHLNPKKANKQRKLV